MRLTPVPFYEEYSFITVCVPIVLRTVICQPILRAQMILYYILVQDTQVAECWVNIVL